MTYDITAMEKFVEDNKSTYVGTYRFHSGYRTEDYAFKSHYYMLDENFRRIDIFAEVFFKDEITYHFSENLNGQEKIFIVKDVLGRAIRRSQYKSSLHYSLYENYVKHHDYNQITLEPIDFYDVFNYMKYHQGINQETVDQFYDFFIPCLEVLLKNKNYKKYMDAVNLLLRNIMYQYEWDGTTAKYLDIEYPFHLYFIRQIIRTVYEHLDKFYKNVPDELFEAVHILCLNERFSFAIMTDFGTMVLSQVNVTKMMIKRLKEEFILFDKENENNDDANLVFSYIYYIFYSDYEQYYAVVLQVFRNVNKYILTFANHDLDLALGHAFIKSEGYQIILDLFREDYNTFVFSCFPIETYPEKFKIQVQEELIQAIQYFSARMENENYRLSSFEQVANINRLLMDNFKGCYK